MDVFLYAAFSCNNRCKSLLCVVSFFLLSRKYFGYDKHFRQGLAIHGGLIKGCFGRYDCGLKYKLNIRKTLDIYAPYVALGQSIGRWGNFVNQEAHGGPTDLPWETTVDGVKVHPTFLCVKYGTRLFLLLLFLRKKKSLTENSLQYIWWFIPWGVLSKGLNGLFDAGFSKSGADYQCSFYCIGSIHLDKR